MAVTSVRLASGNERLTCEVRFITICTGGCMSFFKDDADPIRMNMRCFLN